MGVALWKLSRKEHMKIASLLQRLHDNGDIIDYYAGLCLVRIAIPLVIFMSIWTAAVFEGVLPLVSGTYLSMMAVTFVLVALAYNFNPKKTFEVSL